MNKILYHPKEGTTGFFYGDFPSMPMLNNRTDKWYIETGGYSDPGVWYTQKFELAKQEAINNGEIVDIELLPIEIFKNHCLDPKCGMDGMPCAENYGTVIYHKGSDSRIKDGDTFDLPEGVQVEVYCTTEGMLRHRLVKEQPKQESQIDFSSEEFLLHLCDVVACFTAEQNMYYSTPIRQELIKNAKDTFTIQRKQNETAKNT